MAGLFAGSLTFLFGWTLLLNCVILVALKFTGLGGYIFPSIENTRFVVDSFLLCSVLSSLRCCFGIVNNYRFVYNQAYYNGIFDSIALIVSIIGQILGIYWGVSFQSHVIIIFGIPVLGHLCNLILLCRQRPYLMSSYPESIRLFFKTGIRSVLQDGMKFFFLQFASTFAYSSVPIILSFYSKTTEIGMYGVLARIFSPISSLVTVFLQPQWAYLSSSYLNKDYESIRKNHRFSLLFVIGACAAYMVMLMLLKGSVVKYLLDGNSNFPVSILILFSIQILLLNISNVYSTVLNALNAISYQVKFSLLFVILFLLEIIFFVPSYGLWAVLFFISINIILTSITPSVVKIRNLLQ